METEGALRPLPERHGIIGRVLESISGHLSRKMLEHYSHIRISAKRRALDDLDTERGRAGAGAPDEAPSEPVQ